jgi:hypothetical protein
VAKCRPSRIRLKIEHQPDGTPVGVGRRRSIDLTKARMPPPSWAPAIPNRVKVVVKKTRDATSSR